MNKYIYALLLLGLSLSAKSSDDLDGKVWLELSEEARLTLLIGYNKGLDQGIVSAVDESLKHDKSCQRQSGFNPNDPCLTKQVNDMKTITNKVKSEYAIDRKYKEYSDAITYVYNDPVNREIP